MTEERIKKVIAQADRVLARRADVVDVIEYKLAGTGAGKMDDADAAKLASARERAPNIVAETEQFLNPKTEDMEVKEMTITERINAVVDAREAAAKSTEERIFAYNDWVLGGGGRLLSKEKIAKEECQEAEEALREEALRVYVKTSNKKVAPGVGIRVNTRLDYDPERALGWAVGHNLALKLDAKAFEALARINPIPFVTITEEPQATLSATLEKVGE